MEERAHIFFLWHTRNWLTLGRTVKEEEKQLSCPGTSEPGRSLVCQPRKRDQSLGEDNCGRGAQLPHLGTTGPD